MNSLYLAYARIFSSFFFLLIFYIADKYVVKTKSKYTRIYNWFLLLSLILSVAIVFIVDYNSYTSSILKGYIFVALIFAFDFFRAKRKEKLSD